MEFALLTLTVALGWKVVDTVKFVQAKDWKSVSTQVTAWVAGVAVIFLAGASDWASEQDINGKLLSDLNVASKILVGMALLSVAGVIKDVAESLGSSNTTTTVRVAGQIKPDAE